MLPRPHPQGGTNAELVWFYLKPLVGSLAAAGVMAALLGLVTALVGALVGPCIQVLTAPPGQVLPFVDLLGPRLGDWTTAIVGAGGLPAGDLLAKVPLLLVGLAFAKAFFGLFQWYLWERAGEVASLGLRRDLMASYLLTDPAQRPEHGDTSGEEQLSSAVTTDVKLLREYVVHFYGGLPRELIQVVFLTVTLVLLSPKLTLIFLIGVAPAGWAASSIGRKLRRRAAKALGDYSQLTEWLQQRLLGIETIKHYRSEGIEIANMAALSEGLYRRFQKAARVKARTSPLLEALATVSMVVVLMIALRDISAGRSTGSIELSFFSTLGLLSQAAAKLGRYLNSNREGAAAVDRLRSIFASFTPRRREVVEAARLQYGSEPLIICKNLTAVYHQAATAALSDVSFTFSGGQIYCLAGRSGAGKSTLFNVLLGLVKPTSGDVSLISHHECRGAAVCYMPQKVLLLPGSVAANVAYPDDAPEASRVSESLAKVGLTEVIAALPGGTMAAIGDGGSGLSGGQAQRVLLARLWYHQKPFVLIDEGTSALDPEVERLVYSLLRELAARGAVVITIAHRLAVAEAADILLLLHQGRLTATGKPAAVMTSEAFRQALG